MTWIYSYIVDPASGWLALILCFVLYYKHKNILTWGAVFLAVACDYSNLVDITTRAIRIHWQVFYTMTYHHYLIFKFYFIMLLKFFLQWIETTIENHNQSTELWSPVLEDTSTTQLLHVKFRDNCKRGYRKIVRDRW